MLNSQTAAMVEVNCETDFVARNQQFVSLLRQVAESCIVKHQNKSDAELSTQLLSQEQVANIPSSEVELQRRFFEDFGGGPLILDP